MNATRRSFLALTISVGVIAAACADDSPTATRSSTLPGAERDDEQIDIDREPSSDEDSSDERDGERTGGAGGLFFRLAPFSDCSAFLDHVKAEARDRVGPYGLDGSGYPWGLVDMAASAEDAMEAPATMAPAATDAPEATVGASTRSMQSDGGDDSAGAGSVTGTNTQEQGVDEPDIIKTDGNRIITITENVLTYVDISGAQPAVAGTLTLPDGWGHQLFLYGDRAVLLSNSGVWGGPMPVDVAMPEDVSADSIAPGPMGGLPAATILEVDLTDPTAMRIAATLRIEGQYLNARAIGDRLLLAVSSGPQWMPWLYPQSQSGEQRAREANQQLIDESTLQDWVPQFELVVDGGATSTGDLLSCEHLNHPAEFSGFDVISVLGLDLDDGITNGFDASNSVGVLAGGQTVYASLDRFYVATTKWAGADAIDDEQRLAEWSDDYETDLHAFTVGLDAPVTYVASGTVPGSLLSSFSMDEHDGYLRVLTTDGTPWDQSDLSETRLTVFEEQGDVLTPVGEVGGLGRGEALYSARLIGDRGFAVTFRQVDPFYVLDLSDPTAPRVTGELKIPGFSTYLHPVGEHRVLGVGRAATEEGMVTGLKLSLFDVSDPANPVELSTWTLDDAQSAVEYDYHAFQMIGSTAILPVQSYDASFNGAIVFDIGDAITEVGRISHDDAEQQPTSECRQLVAGDVPESSQAYWMSVDTYMRTQLCTANQASGYGDWYCDAVQAEELGNWFGFATDVVDELTAVNGGELDRIEMCYPQDQYMEAIMRSVVVDGTLWTFSPSALRAHDLTTLEPVAAVDLR